MVSSIKFLNCLNDIDVSFNSITTSSFGFSQNHSFGSKTQCNVLRVIDNVLNKLDLSPLLKMRELKELF